MSLRFIHPKDIKAGMSICGWIGMDALWVGDISEDAKPLPRRSPDARQEYRVRGVYRSARNSNPGDTVESWDISADDDIVVQEST